MKDILYGPKERIISLDQFRGYTVLGMFLVNFLGNFSNIHPTFDHHNTYCSYADTIMPQFFFAVGMAYRLVFMRRMEKDGKFAAVIHAIKRSIGLIILGVVLYGLDGSFNSWADLRQKGLSWFFTTGFRSSPFQTLVHIGVACLWALPVIGGSKRIRIAFMISSGIAHLWLSQAFYYRWVLTNGGIDGGPLGFMTWAIPVLAGSLVYDLVIAHDAKKAAIRLLLSAIILSVIGYLFSCMNAVNHQLADNEPVSGMTGWFVEPPFVAPKRPVDMWTMSQKAGSLSYLLFSSGFSILIFIFFLIICDIKRWKIGVFRSLGQNALAGYLIHGLVADAVRPFVPADSPVWFVLFGFMIFFAITYLFVRHLEKCNIYLRL